MSNDGILLFEANNSGSNRTCGDCQLCCTLLPVKAVGKKANTRCRHQRAGVGCGVYRRSLPTECSLWSCKWLHGGKDTTGLKRPDHSHYVIDVMPDMITVAKDDGSREEWMVLQVWIDPDYPEAHHDPALRAYLERIAARDRMPAVVRNGNASALLLAAPALTDDKQWHEHVINLSGVPGNGFVDRLRRAGR